MTRTQWNAKAAKHAEKLLDITDLWASDDPYELAAASADAFKNGRDPKAFVEEMFGEDLARQAGDEAEFEESLQYEFEDES